MTKKIIVIFFLNMCIAQLYAKIDDVTLKELNIKEIIKKTYFNDSKFPSITYFQFYDQNGRIYAQISFNNNLNSTAIKEYYFYDDKGRLIEEKGVHYSWKNSIITTQKYIYNSKGELDCNEFGKIKYKYDENGKIIECIKKTAKLRDLRTIYFYNSIRQLIEQTEYSGQTCRSKINWEYNESGKIKKRIEIFYDSENDDLTAEYENTFFITRMDF